GGDDDLAQQNLDGPERGVVDVEHGVHVRVPVGHRVEQTDRRDRGYGQRQHDADEHPELGAAVDAGRLLEAVGYALEEVAHDHEVEGVDRDRDDQRPQRVEQAELGHHDEGRDHDTADEHG